MRGGTDNYSRRSKSPCGLSPRARGNLSNPVQPEINFRSIPACAGEPNASRAWRGLRPVYPRVRGGTSRCQARSPPTGGLSPRARGNPTSAVCWGHRRRSIPACAGEPTIQSAGKCLRRVYPRVRGGTLPAYCPPVWLALVYPRVRGGTIPLLMHAFGKPGLSPRARGNLRGGLR